MHSSGQIFVAADTRPLLGRSGVPGDKFNQRCALIYVTVGWADIAFELVNHNLILESLEHYMASNITRKEMSQMFKKIGRKKRDETLKVGGGIVYLCS